MPWNGSTWVPYDVANGSYTDFTGLMEYANSITGDLFGIMLLGSIFFVLFIGLSTRDDSTALAASMFITTIASYIMAAANIVGDFVAYAMTMLLVGAVILQGKKGGSNV